MGTILKRLSSDEVFSIDDFLFDDDHAKVSKALCRKVEGKFDDAGGAWPNTH